MRKSPLFALISLIVSTACAADILPAANPYAADGPTLTPFAPGTFTEDSQNNASPIPENIVQAFLTDVQEAPDQIQGYMSSLLMERYPGTSIIEALNIDGIIEGFAVRSATSNDIMGLSYVTAGISTQNSNIEIQFTLIKENEIWVISAFEINPAD